jgi:gamma-glutamyltranspeptidase/glutathione hydrolase
MKTASRVAIASFALLFVVALTPGGPASAAQPPSSNQPTAIGIGGAAATVDPLATRTAIEVLRAGGNAVDAAVAAAAVLGVVEPFACGIGGGGFMTIYRASDGRVFTLDGRATAPQAFTSTSFIDPATGTPFPFSEAVTSGLSVGVPGTPRLWEKALARFGRLPLAAVLAPAIVIAHQGFAVDQTFRDQVISNLPRFRVFSSTAGLYGAAPAVGSTFRNTDLAKTYLAIAALGTKAFYKGPLAAAIVETVQHPPLASDATYLPRPGVMTKADLAGYEVLERTPAAVGYRDYDVFGVAPPSSGGSTVGEALNILEDFDLAGAPRELALHWMLEASKLSFADRAFYIGDPAFVEVPLVGLLSDDYAAVRRSLIGSTALTTPVAPGNPNGFDTSASPVVGGEIEGQSTTHLTVSDRFGNVVSYTFTLEQIGGSGIVVPGYGFLLNNELTDFSFAPITAGAPDPNLPAPGKRPRASMAPTIVLKNGKPVVALGSPEGSTIITTVLQLLVEHLDLGKTLPEAIATPRLSQRNTSVTQTEPAFPVTLEAQALAARGHTFTVVPAIGAVTGIEFLPNGLVRAAAEPVRRGGGSAMVEIPIGTKEACTNGGWRLWTRPDGSAFRNQGDCIQFVNTGR